MDGVLVDVGSSWKFVHRELGTDNEDNLKKYVDGEIDYLELIKRDVEQWGNMHVNTLKEILSQAPLIKGAENTVSELRKNGYKTAIISAGIYALAERIQRICGIDHVFANKIHVDQRGMLTGEADEIVELLKKKEVLTRLAHQEKTTPNSCAFVGDSVWDIPVFKEAGFSIAFNTTNWEVMEAADVAIEGKDLSKVLRYFPQVGSI